ncbi:hypothetical protein [Dendrosporobacter sp. 1207_IL3150]|uniref:hypothetical protein n=1 Tax=Dendrosporobacter sp. 1207_IL3150 TaxID=3084054 RepID=UPI002FDA3C8C
MISSKELRHLDDYLTFQKAHIRNLEYFHHYVKDIAMAQEMLDLIKKNENMFSKLSKHINYGQPLYP